MPAGRPKGYPLLRMVAVKRSKRSRTWSRHGLVRVTLALAAGVALRCENTTLSLFPIEETSSAGAGMAGSAGMNESGGAGESSKGGGGFGDGVAGGVNGGDAGTGGQGGRGLGSGGRAGGAAGGAAGGFSVAGGAPYCPDITVKTPCDSATCAPCDDTCSSNSCEGEYCVCRSSADCKNDEQVCDLCTGRCAWPCDASNGDFTCPLYGTTASPIGSCGAITFGSPRGACVECIDTYHCSAGQFCRNRRCVDCQRNEDCTWPRFFGTICLDGSCGCRRDEDCRMGQNGSALVCQEGKCRPAP